MTKAVALVAIFVVIAGAEGAQAQSRGPEDYGSRYGLITEKNIFVRNRPPTRSGSRNNARSSAPRRPEESFVLRGVTLQEGRNVAFVENTATQSTQRLVAGDAVAGGKIVAMQYDSLEFESNGRREHIRIGRNLLGDMYSGGAGGSSSPFATTSPTTGPTTGPSGGAGGSADTAAKGPETPPLPNAENLSLEERMKLRAQQLRK
jgi:hypothetical protein